MISVGRAESSAAAVHAGRDDEHAIYTPKTASVVVQSSTKRQREKEANLAGFQ